MPQPPLRIATRESALALWQARFIQTSLLQIGVKSELLPMTTRGDQILDRPLQQVGGKGLFIKELEVALLNGEADLAAHSLKDLPATLADEFELSTVCAAADPRDALVSNQFASIVELPDGARVGTSSLRRQCQLLALRPDLKIEPLRGNVNTRLSKLDRGDFDAIILACAGLDRLEFSDRIRQRIDIDILLPAVTQGVVGIEIRAGDEQTRELLAPLHHQITARRVAAERAVNARLGGSCQTPIAIHAIEVDRLMTIRALVGSNDGTIQLRAELTGDPENGIAMGNKVADQLLDQGADKLLAADD
ncbi:MAG: hydroxymethylbilane synthase [Immundisolibacteraceae bacterium]|nr:hydroxymethylbilane synthase [Immundisolibacteraceae bacterium]